MNYNEALSFIHSRMKFGSRPGMERISALCKALGDPQNSLKFVHVAGTNGKGSTCSMIAEMLRAAGYRVGLFISPFILDFRERIQVNSQMISEQDFALLADELRAVTVELDKSGIEPTEFELITAAAFLYFLRQKCDIVVLEVGMGGLLDSTNIINQSEVSVITSVSMDHMNVLGNSLMEIAAHKCGIIKRGGSLVCYPQPDFSVERYIKDRAREADCTYTPSELSKIRLISSELDGSTIIYGGCTFKIPLAGKHQIYNFSTAVAAVNVLKQKGWQISMKNVIDGIANVKMPARTEVISRDPLIILDGGHNTEGVDALCNVLKNYCSERKIIAVIAMMRDKDYKNCIAELAPMCNYIYTTAASVPRSLEPEALAREAQAYCSDVTAVDDFGKAYELAVKKAGKDDVVLVCGSLYLASDIKNLQK